MVRRGVTHHGDRSVRGRDRAGRVRVAWVTGSFQGIGRAIANEFARFGVRVAVHGIHDDGPGYFSDETPKTMQQVISEIASAYNAEAMAVFRFLIQRRLTIIEKPQQALH